MDVFCPVWERSGPHMSVVAIHKNSWSSFLEKARALSFHVFSKAVAKERGGITNVKFAWCAVSSKEEIETIISCGFCDFSNSGLFGFGVCLPMVLLWRGIFEKSRASYYTHFARLGCHFRLLCLFLTSFCLKPWMCLPSI